MKLRHSGVGLILLSWIGCSDGEVIETTSPDSSNASGRVSTVDADTAPLDDAGRLPSADAYEEGDAEPHGQLDAETLFQIGLRHAHEGNVQAAIDHFDRALELDDRNPYLLDAKSTVLYTQGEFTQALALSESAVALLPDSPGLRVNRGLLYVQFARGKEAEQDYRMALELDASFAPAHYNLGVLHYNQGMNREALQDFSAAIDADPGMANYWFNRAMTQESLGDLDAAKEDMKCFLERVKSDDHRALGETLLQRWEGGPPTGP